jgi:hypothetical protein
MHVLICGGGAIGTSIGGRLGGSGFTTRSCGRWSGKVFRTARLPVKPATVVVLAAASSSSVVLPRARGGSQLCGQAQGDDRCVGLGGY